MNNWRSYKIKYIFNERNQKGFPNEPLLAATQSKGVVKKDDYENRTVVALKNLENLKLVKKGDFVISLRSFQGGIEYSYDQGIISTAYTIITLKDGEPSYFKYYFKSHSFVKGLTQYVTGIRQGQNINYNELKNSTIYLPPLPEQQQIVQFLDRKTAQIDELIEKKKRKIELLKEQRTALINHVVTKGLDDNAPMKASGVKWIGEIPGHWEVGKLYQYATLQSGATPSRVVPEYWEDGEVKWMSSGEINKRIIREVGGRITQLGHENSNTPILPVKTVMIGLNGQGKTKGTVGILETETTCNQSLCGIIFNENIEPYFQLYFLDSQYYHLRGLVGEGKREGISVGFLKLYPTLIPPLNEQERIADYLDKQTQIIDSTIEKEQQKIDLLIEYRQSLISEVVTGKIDVRSWSPTGFGKGVPA